MKKFICLCAAILLCLSTAMAASLYVPKSSGSLPDMPAMPECPEIVRVQTTEDSVTITLTQPLPDNAQVTAWLRDADYCHYFYFAEPGDGNTYTATAPVPMPGDEWMNFDIFWYRTIINFINNLWIDLRFIFVFHKLIPHFFNNSKPSAALSDELMKSSTLIFS